MSQRSYLVKMKDGGTVQVLTGYDRPLDFCFLVVRHHPSGERLWSNLSPLDLPGGPGMTPDSVMQKIRDLDLPAPLGLRLLLEADHARQAGNEETDLGTFTQR